MPQAVVLRDNERQRLKPQGGNTQPSQGPPQLYCERGRKEKKKHRIITPTPLPPPPKKAVLMVRTVETDTVNVDGVKHQLKVDWSRFLRRKLFFVMSLPHC